jgi:hypothetical protein
MLSVGEFVRGTMRPSKIKLLLWLTILTLIVGCVPTFSTPTPVPPLDANSINLIIAQTADAASTQTLAAMPPATSTVTLTPTPRSTLTPEPTFTLVPTFLFPTATPVVRFQYYRVKHDHQLAMYNYKSRTEDGNSEGMLRQTAEVVPLLVLPKEKSGTDRTRLSGGWEVFIDALNNNDPKKLPYLKSKGTALFNTAGFPQLESLTMGGNIVRLEEIRDGWGRVRTMDYSMPPNAAAVNYFTNPDLVHKFVVVGWKRSTKSTILVKPPKGDLYWPLVTRRPVWIQMERLEAFPPLPLEVTATKDLHIQTTPGPTIDKTGRLLAAGQSANVIAYQPAGPNVWGKLPNGRWIPLLYGGQYFTSWKMETVPPP